MKLLFDLSDNLMCVVTLAGPDLLTYVIITKGLETLIYVIMHTPFMYVIVPTGSGILS